jgi:GTPase SAR1 family protein
VPTQRIHFASKTIAVSELQVKCQLWDMRQPADSDKQDGFTGLADSLCKKAAAVLLLFDLASRASFEGLERWVQDVRLKCD